MNQIPYYFLGRLAPKIKNVDNSKQAEPYIDSTNVDNLTRGDSHIEGNSRATILTNFRIALNRYLTTYHPREATH
ncbi:MAG: hypothetical protein AABX11_06490 [Nanoarchaeota archaeon]